MISANSLAEKLPKAVNSAAIVSDSKSLEEGKGCFIGFNRLGLTRKVYNVQKVLFLSKEELFLSKAYQL